MRMKRDEQTRTAFDQHLKQLLWLQLGLFNLLHAIVAAHWSSFAVQTVTDMVEQVCETGMMRFFNLQSTCNFAVFGTGCAISMIALLVVGLLLTNVGMNTALTFFLGFFYLVTQGYVIKAAWIGAGVILEHWWFRVLCRATIKHKIATPDVALGITDAVVLIITLLVFLLFEAEPHQRLSCLQVWRWSEFVNDSDGRHCELLWSLWHTARGL